LPVDFSGFTSIAEKLKDVKELKLLIGNTTNRETLEQLAEGRRRLELVRDSAETQRYPKKTDIKYIENETAENIRSSMELMDQTDEGEKLVNELVTWFDELWDEAEDFNEILMEEMKQSWAVAPVRPYDIYMKTLYTLVKDRLEGDDDRDILWDDDITRELADFQKAAVRQAIRIIPVYGGVFVSDVVGLGKSYIGSAIIKHFERTYHVRSLIICPAPLKEMWEPYNERYELNARVLSMGMLREDDDNGLNMLMNNPIYRDRDFLLLDESHNFRHTDTQRYKVLQLFLSTGKHCCFLTATPRNKTAWDVYYQMKLFLQDDKTDLPIDPPDLRQYFRAVERGEKQLKDMLSNVLIRRTRNHILKWYGFDADTHLPVDPNKFNEYLGGSKKAYVIVAGKHQFFPRRDLDTIEYSIEDTYKGLYQQLRGYLGKSRKGYSSKPVKGELSYARYGLWHFVVPAK
jgi:hypothetical protein